MFYKILDDAQRTALKTLRQNGNAWGLYPEWRCAPPDPTWGQPVDLAYIAYITTGDEKWLNIAAQAEMPVLPANRNDSRQLTMNCAMHYMFTRQAMEPDQQSRWVNNLKSWGEFIVGNTRDGDSDESLGHLLGVATIDLVLGTSFSQDPRLDAPRAATNARAKQASDGCWVEGSEYNLNTMSLLCLGALVLGPDCFPWVRDFIPKLGEYLSWSLTYDLQYPEEHGDREKFRDPEIYYRLPLMSMVRTLGGDPNDELLSIAAKYTEAINTDPHDVYAFNVGLMPIYWCYDPTELMEARGMPVKLPTGAKIFSGVGLCLHRTENSYFQALINNPIWDDHDYSYGFRDVRWYQDGEWVLDRSGGYAIHWDSLNSAGVYGVGWMSRQLLDANGDATTLIAQGQMNGPWQRPGTFDPVDQFKDFLWTTAIHYQANSSLIVIDSWKGIPDRPPWADANAAPFEVRFWASAEPQRIKTENSYVWFWKLPSGKYAVLSCIGTSAFDSDFLPASNRGYDWWVVRLQFQSREGTLSSTLSVSNEVPVGPVDPPTPPIPVSLPKDSKILSENIPLTVQAGQQFPVEIKIQNTGTNTWVAKSPENPNGYNLGERSDDARTWGNTRFMWQGKEPIPPQGIADFQITLKAPSVAGLYTLMLRMVEENVDWVGATIIKKIKVSDAPPPIPVPPDPVTIKFPIVYSDGGDRTYTVYEDRLVIVETTKTIVPVVVGGPK